VFAREIGALETKNGIIYKVTGDLVLVYRCFGHYE
jgi:hypothetical protein